MANVSGRGAPMGRSLRVGVVNVMPRLETYEPALRALTASTGLDVELVWVRLTTHGYRSSDPAHLAAHYVTYDRALASGGLDGLVLTGAPVEHLPLRDVRYWPELTEVLDHARAHLASTLGICWGAMALGEREGLRREVYARKVFGVYAHRVAARATSLLGLDPAGFFCPHSRFAGFSFDDALAAERQGRVDLLGASGDAGPTLLATPDGRVVMHLGHPEYDVSRIAYEWQRDHAAGRADVDPPRGFDLGAGRPIAAWEGDSARLFHGWLRRLAPTVGVGEENSSPPLAVATR